MLRESRRWAAALLAVPLAACGGGGSPRSPDSAATSASLSPQAAAGKALFCDTRLSASGKPSCGTCHVPVRAFTADPATDHGLPVIDALVAFLCTLTNGYDPRSPATYNVPAQCQPGAP